MSTQFVVLTCRTIIHQVAHIFSSFFTTLLPFLPVPPWLSYFAPSTSLSQTSTRLLDMMLTSPHDAGSSMHHRLHRFVIVVSHFAPLTGRCDADFAPSTPVLLCLSNFALSTSWSQTSPPSLLSLLQCFPIPGVWSATVRAIFAQCSATGR